MSEWRTAEAPAKLNLALVVGPRRPDGKHEVVTVMERLSLHDTLAVRPAPATRVTGFEDDTLVAAALDAVANAAGGRQRFEARIEKRIPVAAGLGGGSSDAAATLRLANELLDTPLEHDALHDLAAALGADVPFFLGNGTQLASGDGTTLAPLALPRDYVVLLALPDGVAKSSTRSVYVAFDARHGEEGYPGSSRRAARRARRAARARRPRATPAERPRLLTARGRAPRSGGVSCRRDGRRSGRLRAVRDRARGRSRPRPRWPAVRAPGSRNPADTFISCRATS